MSGSVPFGMRIVFQCDDLVADERLDRGDVAGVDELAPCELRSRALDDYPADEQEQREEQTATAITRP